MHWHLFIMIDARVETLKEEQTHNDHRKEYCTSQLDLSDDKRKRRAVSDAESTTESAEQLLAVLKEEIAVWRPESRVWIKL